MANTHASLASLFTDTANAIRAKTGSTDAIVADDFPTAIVGIPMGGAYAGTLCNSSTFESLMGYTAVKVVFDALT